MEKVFLILAYLFIIPMIVFLMGCDRIDQVDYIGKTRNDVIRLCADYSKFPHPSDAKKEKKIMIGFNSGYRYYDSVDQAIHDKNLMNATSININFKYGKKWWRRGLYYYTVYFDNQGVVVNQKESFSCD